MPDLRADLGWLADFVGEPATLRDLETARRRRERRRRTSALGVGLAILAAMAVVAAVELRPRGEAHIPVSSPSETGVPTASGTITIWPENPVNGESAQNVQAAVDAGDQDVQWRTDPSEVVDHFGKQILGRSMRVVGISQGDDGTTVRAFPCPPGEEPGAVSCDVLVGDPISFTLGQPASLGDDGIWSILGVRSEPLSILPPVGIGASVSEGQEIDLDLSQLVPSTAAHVGIVTSNGCESSAWSLDVNDNGTSSLVVPQLEGGDASCAVPTAGYIYAYATDDTTMPSEDPINEPTAIEYPWITIYPVAIATEVDPSPGETSSAPPSETATSEAASELAIACDGDSTLVEGSGLVAAQSDGVRLTVTNRGGASTQFNIADGSKNVDLGPDEEKRLVEPLDPGKHFVLCSVEGGTFTRGIEVVDPNGYWFTSNPDCSADQSAQGDFDAELLDISGDPSDEILAAGTSILESNIPGSALEAGYEVRTGLYPDQEGTRAIVAVDPAGHVIGAVWFGGHGSEWAPSSFSTCDANVIF